MVDDAAVNFISQNEAAALLKKKKKKKKRISFLEDEEFVSDDDQMDVLMGESDDSDWCPNSPGIRNREKKVKLDDSVIVDFQDNQSQIIVDKVSEDMGENFAALKVKHLKDLCRARGLPVGGRKADLVERLQADSNSKLSFDGSQSITHKSPTGSTSEGEKKGE